MEGSQTAQCDKKTGKCLCLDGLAGRRCDRCDRGTTGQAPFCKKCGECFDDYDKSLSFLNRKETKLTLEIS
jgi:laminin beta 1